MSLEINELVEVESVVRKPFGCFVRVLMTGEDGLILIPEMLDNDRLNEDDMPEPGSRFMAKVLYISDDVPRKISLCIKPSQTGIQWHKNLS